MGIEPVRGIAAAPVGGWQPKSSPEIDKAVKDITKLIDSSGWFHYVDAGDVSKAANILAKMDPASADAVIDKLAEKGLLDDFAREAVDDSWVGGGLSKSERGQLFANMAKQLDGKSLAALEKAFAETSGGTDRTSRVDELSKAIATHASSAAKVDFVREMATRSTDEDGRTSTVNIGGSFSDTKVGDPEALAIANVVSSLKGSPGYAKDALAALNQEQFAKVIEAATGRTDSLSTTGSGYGQISSTHSARFDPQALVGFADVVAANGSVAQKAEFVSLAGKQLKGILNEGGKANGPAEKQVRDSITKVLDGHASEIIEQLATNVNSLDGEGLSAYAKSLLQSGAEGEKTLGKHLHALGYGDDGKGDPVARLKKVGESENKVAAALGYFAGSVWSAADSIKTDKAAKAELWTDVLSAAAQFHPVSASASVFFKYGAKALIDPGKPNIGEQIYKSALPTDKEGNLPKDKLGNVIIDTGTVHTYFENVKTFSNN